MTEESSNSYDIHLLYARIRVLETQFKTANEARIAQAVEYERRLAELNHAHAQAQKKEGEYLKKEVYEKSEYERRTWQNRIDVIIAEGAGKRATSVSLFATAMAIASLVLWGVSIYLQR